MVASSALPASQMKSFSCQRGICEREVGRSTRRERKNEVAAGSTLRSALAAQLQTPHDVRRLHEPIGERHAVKVSESFSILTRSLLGTRGTSAVLMVSTILRSCSM